MILEEYIEHFNSLLPETKKEDLIDYISLLGDVLNGLIWLGFLVGWISLIKKISGKEGRTLRKENKDYKLIQSINSFISFKEYSEEFGKPKFLIKDEKELLIALNFYLRKDRILRKKLRFKRLVVKLVGDDFEIQVKSLFRTNHYKLVVVSSKLLMLLGTMIEENKNA